MRPDSEESTLSYWTRRGAGILGVTAFVFILASILLGREIGFVPVIVALLLPTATVIAHINLTTVLSPEEKRIWRGQMIWSTSQFIAVWAYLFAADLKDRTRGFTKRRS
jgi:hypothetical protein